MPILWSCSPNNLIQLKHHVPQMNRPQNDIGNHLGLCVAGGLLSGVGRRIKIVKCRFALALGLLCLDFGFTLSKWLFGYSWPFG